MVETPSTDGGGAAYSCREYSSSMQFKLTFIKKLWHNWMKTQFHCVHNARCRHSSAEAHSLLHVFSGGFHVIYQQMANFWYHWTHYFSIINCEVKVNFSAKKSNSNMKLNEQQQTKIKKGSTEQKLFRHLSRRLKCAPIQASIYDATFMTASQ